MQINMLERFSKGFALAVLVYLIALVYGLGFILTGISFGNFTPDFWLITLIVIVPIILSLVYVVRYRAGFLFRHTKLLKKLIVIFMIIAAVFVTVFIVPLSY